MSAIVQNSFQQDYIVLIVDDNATNLGVAADHFREHGFRIMTATNGELGLKRAKLGHPDIILLDVMMPDIDGFETCRRLKADSATQDIPVIFMTALANVEDKVKGFEVGGVDYITKPFQHEEVLARVTTHLRIRDLAHSLQSANQELTELTQSLQKANADKDKFFSIVAHDLKGPFMPLLGNLEFLIEMAETSPPLETKKMGESAYLSAKNVYNLLENLLQWARLEQGRMEHQPVIFNLRLIAEQVIDLLEANAVAKGLVLQNNVPPGVLVYADENMLSTVVRNLTSNALKFTSRGGQVTISSQMPAVMSQKTDSLLPTSYSLVEVSVTDTGVGVSQTDAAKLFKIEVHHSTIGTAKEKGTGLGLIICKEMVEKNGGQIWVESEVGKGTAVKFTVPLVDFGLPMSNFGLGEQSEIGHQPSATENLVPPPPEEIAILSQLTMVGDMHGLAERANYLKQLGEPYIPFANKLRALARGFEEEEILALISQTA